MCVSFRGSGHDVLHLPETGGRFLLSGKNHPNRTGHNGFENGQKNNAGSSMLVTREEGTSVSVCLEFHPSMSYADEDKIVLVKDLNMKKVKIENYPLFACHEYV